MKRNAKILLMVEKNNIQSGSATAPEMKNKKADEKKEDLMKQTRQILTSLENVEFSKPTKGYTPRYKENACGYQDVNRECSMYSRITTNIESPELTADVSAYKDSKTDDTSFTSRYYSEMVLAPKLTDGDISYTVGYNDVYAFEDSKREESLEPTDDETSSTSRYYSGMELALKLTDGDIRGTPRYDDVYASHDLEREECQELTNDDTDYMPTSHEESEISMECEREDIIEMNHEAGNLLLLEPKTTDFPKKSDKKKKIRRKDYCFYCENLVLNYARHIFRNHGYEFEVQKICSKPKNSIDRKKLLTALRKKGNYIQNEKDCVKPMRTMKQTDYLPCIYCLGFYSRRLLWKHKKKCTSKIASANIQSEGQNLLLRHLKVDNNLRENVFPKMRADKVSLIAKSDPLICAYAAQYLKSHREKHFLNVASQKMRELARLLIEVKTMNPSVSNLYQLLKPENYDTIVAAAKNSAKYNVEKDKYLSPTYAMNIVTSLKQCCSLALMQVIKKEIDVDRAESEACLKTMIQLLEANWRYDVSNHAADDLNHKKWNKVTIVPLANDLKIFKQHLVNISIDATSKIKDGNHTREIYLDLLETVYCRVLLLNRRRPGELQRIRLDDYLNPQETENNYEEFDRALTPAERVLIQKFKRIVIKGKRSRGVPVLLNSEVQNDLQILISLRDKYLSKSNPYLFGKPGYETPIYGYKILRKLASSCGAKNPKAISSTKLRKHLATLTQIFSMTENDIEQLANFMGHTSAVHKKSYRLPDDIYQTAKISKLLLLMEDGKADAFKGKSLDEIELDLDEEITGEEIEVDDILDRDFIAPDDIPLVPIEAEPSTSELLPESRLHNNLNVQNCKKRFLVPWTTEQKKVVTTFFKNHIENNKPPRKHECDQIKELHPELLSNKDWLKIKVYIQNVYKKQ